MNDSTFKSAAITEDQAWAILRLNEKLFADQNVPEILAGFSDDADVEFAVELQAFIAGGAFCQWLSDTVGPLGVLQRKDGGRRP